MQERKGVKMVKYYDGTRLLSMTDINGHKPELFISTSNRSAGKTTYFNRLVMNRYFKKKEKFCLLYRYTYELDGVGEKFFKDIKKLFFPDYIMKDKTKEKGIYKELIVLKEDEADEKDAGELCGYAICLNKADQIKRNSHLFNDVTSILFDEFMSETNKYCSNEVTKFMSIHTSLARGNGKMTRYLPVYMIGNLISLLNPYYVALGISNKLSIDTNFLKGKGFVVEQGFNTTAASAQKESAFNQAFKSNEYFVTNTQKIYLNDNYTFIDKPTGRGEYLATVKFEGKEYAIRKYTKEGIIYCDRTADSTFPRKISLTTDDHNINFVLLHEMNDFVVLMRYFFDVGCFRFKDLDCKNVILTMLSYN